MFWQRNEDNIQKTFELTEGKRTTDPWMKAVLKADRQCCETWEMYCFIHGCPAKSGSWNAETGEVDCRGKNCTSLANAWAELYLGTEKKKKLAWKWNA